MIATSRPRCPTPCRRASAPTTAGATAPSAQPSRRGLRPIAPPMPPLAPVTRTRQRWSCMNRWYPWRGSGRPAALGRLRVLGVVPRSTEPSWRRSAVNAGREPWPQSRAHRQTRNGRNFSIGQAVSRYSSPIQRGSARSNRRRYAARNTTVAGTAIRPSGGSPGLGRRRYIAPPFRREEPNEPCNVTRRTRSRDR